MVVAEQVTARGAKVNGHEVLPQQTGELDGRDAVGPDLGFGAHLHPYPDPVVRELDALHAADLDAGHFDAVANFEVRNVCKQGVDVLAALEPLQAADSFQNDRRRDHRQGDKDAKTGFQGVLHTSFLSLFLEGGVKSV